MNTAPLPLLHESAALLVIDKPPGLLVHPTGLDAHETDTALQRLQAQCGQRLWPLHRLDKATSGALAFARHAEAARAGAAAFEQGEVSKHYLALVRGWPAALGEIDHPLARDPERPSAGQPRLPACTRWRVLQRFEWPFGDGRHASSRYALLQVQPLTGRRHQIRRHFKHLAHPLVGDTTHGKGAHNRAVAAWLGSSRLWLHAWHLALPALAGGPAVAVLAPPGPAWAALGPPAGPPADLG